MAKLPFVVQPRLKPIIEQIGSEDAGYIEIERKGYLTGGEKAFVQQVQHQDTGTIKLIGLSRKIAADRKMPLDKAYTMVLEIMSGNAKGKVAEEVESEYAIEFQQTLGDLANARARESLVHAACMVMHRVDPDITFDLISELHPDIVSGLDQLYRDEEMKSVARLMEANESSSDDKSTQEVNVEEIEKKQEEKSM